MNIGTAPKRARWGTWMAFASLMQRIVRHPLPKLFLFAVCAQGCFGEGTGAGNDNPEFKPFFVYTANLGSDDVSMFQGRRDGTLIFLGKVPAGDGPAEIAVNEAFVFVANSLEDSISMYRIGVDGRLTPATPAKTPTGDGPTQLKVERNPSAADDRLYVSCAGSNEVVIYDIRPTTGLAEVQRVPTAGSPGEIAFGVNMYVPSLLNDNIMSFRGSPSGYIAGLPPFALTGDGSTQALRQNDTLLVMNTLGGTISMFDTSFNGASPRLIPVGSVTTGLGPTAMISDYSTGTSSANVYVVNRGISTISRYRADMAGKLSPSVGAQVQAGSNATDIDIAYSGAVPYLRFAYVTNEGGQLRMYSRDTDGLLTYVQSYDTDGTVTNALAISDHVLSLPPIAIANASLPAGTAGVAYSENLLVTGGNGDRAANFTVRSGTLPPGLSFSHVQSGEADRATKLVGTPTVAGTYTFKLGAAQPGIASVDKQFTMVIGAGVGALTITTTTMALATVGVAYSAPIGTSGGTAAAKGWSITAGSLPTGLAMSTSTGTVSGTPTNSGTFDFTVRVAQGSVSDTQALTILVQAGVIPAKASLLNLNERARAVDMYFDGVRVIRGSTVPSSRVNIPIESKFVAAKLTLADDAAIIGGVSISVLDGNDVMFVFGSDANGAVDQMMVAVRRSSLFTDKTKAHVLFVNSNRRLGNVDLYVTAPSATLAASTPVASNVFFTGDADFLVPPGTLRVRMTPAGDKNTVLADSNGFGNETFVAGRRYHAAAYWDTVGLGGAPAVYVVPGSTFP